MSCAERFPRKRNPWLNFEHLNISFDHQLDHTEEEEDEEEEDVLLPWSQSGTSRYCTYVHRV
jgi:hypothetical protein